jgi:hypothetical protein
MTISVGLEPQPNLNLEDLKVKFGIENSSISLAQQCFDVALKACKERNWAILQETQTSLSNLHF